MKPTPSMQMVIKHPVKTTMRRTFVPSGPSAPAHLVAIIEPRYPHITDRITLLWGTWDLQQYLSKLIALEDPKRPNRQGFPINIMSALLKIYVEHTKIAPTEDPRDSKKRNAILWESPFR